MVHDTTMSTPQPRVMSVNIGRAQEIEHNGRRVTTAIAKTPTSHPQVVRGAHIGDDEQADPAAHGGTHKAVYAYAVEDYRWWQDQLGRPLPPGLFGENLTTAGLDISRARVGDRWSIGSAVLEVSEPRVPCFKLGIAVGEPRFQQTFGRANRPGTYLRIIEEGVVQANDTIDVTPTTQPSIEIAAISDIYANRRSDAHELLDIEGLSDPWRRWARDHSEAHPR